MLERMKDVLRNRKEGDKGFSLVELAVVIVIIGILVAIAVPVFTSMQASANKAKDSANAANASSMIAAAVANSSTGSILKGDAVTEIGKLKVDGNAILTATNLTTVPADAASVDLTNYCVTINAAKSGPGC